MYIHEINYKLYDKIVVNGIEGMIHKVLNDNRFLVILSRVITFKGKLTNTVIVKPSIMYTIES